MEKTVKKHKDAIKTLREKLKTLAVKKPELRRQINALKFDAEGKRRPETGPQRHAMKFNYDSNVRPGIRTALVAYGILRGIQYKRIERNPVIRNYENSWLISNVLEEIHKAIGDNAELKAEWTKDRVKAIIKDGVDPIALEAA